MIRSRPLTSLLLLCLGLAWPDGSAAAQARIVKLQLESATYENTRTLRVWLPPGYDESIHDGHVYPVLYLNDGQNLFDSATAVLNNAEWRVDETALDLIGEGSIEPIVVVGIDNAGRRGRAREYLPYPDSFLQPPEPDPQGDRYGEFLRKEVIPAVEARFRVGRGPEDRALGGSSYGALVTMFVAATDDSLFDRLLLESPSFYVDHGHIFQDVANSRPTLDRIYMGIGTNELALDPCDEAHEGNREAVRDVRRMQALLEQTGEKSGTQVRVFVEACAIHHERAWARRLPEALQFLFGR